MAPPPPDGGENIAHIALDDGISSFWLPSASSESATVAHSAPKLAVVDDAEKYHVTPDTAGLLAIMPEEKLHDALSDLTEFERRALTTYLALQVKTHETRVLRDQAMQMMQQETRNKTATVLGVAYVAAYTKKAAPTIEKTAQAFDQYRDERSVALANLRRVPHAYRLAQTLGATRSPRKGAALLHALHRHQTTSITSLAHLKNIIPFIPKGDLAHSSKTINAKGAQAGMRRVEQHIRQLVTALDAEVPVDWNGEHEMQLAGERFYPTATPVSEVAPAAAPAAANITSQASNRQLYAMEGNASQGKGTQKLYDFISKLAPEIKPAEERYDTSYTVNPEDRLRRTDNYGEILGMLYKYWPRLNIDPADQPIQSSTAKDIPHASATLIQKHYGLRGNYRTPADISRAPHGPELYTYPYERLRTTDPHEATPWADAIGRSIGKGLRIAAAIIGLSLPTSKVAIDQLPEPKKHTIATVIKPAPQTPTETEQAYDRLANIIPPQILSEAKQRIQQDLQQSPAMRAIIRELQELRTVRTDWAVTRRKELVRQQAQLEQAAHAEYTSMIRTADQRLQPISETQQTALVKALKNELQTAALSLPSGGSAIIISKTSQIAVIAQKTGAAQGSHMAITSVLPTGVLDAKTGVYTIGEIAYGGKSIGNNPTEQRAKITDERNTRIAALSHHPHRSRIERQELGRLLLEQAFTNAAHNLNGDRYRIGSGTTPRNATQVIMKAAASTGADITLSSVDGIGTRLGTLEGLYLAHLAQYGAPIQITVTALPTEKTLPDQIPSPPGVFLASAR